MGCKESGSKSPKLTGDVSRFCHARVTLLSRFCHTFVTKKRYQEKSKSIYSVTKSYAHAHVRGSLSHLSKGRWVGWVTKGCGQTRRFGFRSAGTKLATDCRPKGLGKTEALSFHGLPLTQTEGEEAGRKESNCNNWRANDADHLHRTGTKYSGWPVRWSRECSEAKAAQ